MGYLNTQSKNSNTPIFKQASYAPKFGSILDDLVRKIKAAIGLKVKPNIVLGGKVTPKDIEKLKQLSKANKAENLLHSIKSPQYGPYTAPKL
jgi:translation initiation factor 2 beta subunit (eIF-2beta)/eIF-5